MTESYYTLAFGKNCSEVKKIVSENKTVGYNDLVKLVQKLKLEISGKDQKILELGRLLGDHSIQVPTMVGEVEGGD